MATKIWEDDIKTCLKPICAICNKEVDKMEFAMDYRENKVHIVVLCHGERDIATMEPYLHLDKSIRRGIAFQTKRIEEIKRLEGKDGIQR